MAIADHRKLVRSLYEAFNRNDTGRVRELLSPDFVDHEIDPSLGIPEGVEGAVAWFAAMHEAMPDIRMDIQDVVAEGDRVAVRARITGTHQGEMFGIPPSGRTIDMQTLDILRIADGAVAEHWGLSDDQSLMQQIGVAPTPAQVAAVQAVYQAFGRGDIGAILARLSDDVALEPGAADHSIPWILPGSGKGAVERFFRVTADTLDIHRLEPRTFLATGGQVAVVVDIEATVKATGATLADTEVHLWTVDEEGRITSLRHVVDTKKHAAAAGV